MFWADKIAQQIISSGKHKPYWVDDMFTPSGYAHIGSLRGPLVHDVVYRALKDQNPDVTFTYVFNDFDPVDGLPPDLAESEHESLGLPLRLAKSPNPGYESFADYFASDFKLVLQSLGFRAEFLSSWDMYRAGKFNQVIKIALDHASQIQDIYQKISGSKKREAGWLPLQVICENCQKLGTTRVHDWDGETVEYTCELHLVKWAKGCGNTARVSPYDGRGKLPWKVDWPAHWNVLGITIEGAGKDHSSAGGSRDIAKELCKHVFHYPDPFNIPYEFFLIGGKKMSSSKGLGLKARDLTNLLPAEIARFLFTRTDYSQAIEFDPVETMAIPDLFDEYDRCWKAFNEGGNEDLSRAFILAQISTIPEKQKKLFLPRFREIATYMQHPSITIEEKFAQTKGSPLTELEMSLLQSRQKYAKIWLDSYAPQEHKMHMSAQVPETASLLSAEQKDYLHRIIPLVEKNDDAEVLQTELYSMTKSLGINPKKAFAAIYLSFIGREHGPKAAWFLLQYPREQVITRLQEIAKLSDKPTGMPVNTFHKNEYFVIDEQLRKKYPSISVGIALIRDVQITKSHPELEKEKNDFLKSLEGLTTEQLRFYPELVSYRKLYKEMGIDWHSRRPSPEALLRRVALGKGLYSINTCVDAYNLVVMKHHVSVGAFDANEVKFPTILRFAKKGEGILLLGDTELTNYSPKEIAYFDQAGGYNLDFNYRDAQRTMVTEKTRNLWINVEGVYEISPSQVTRSLRETIEMIQKYCGGKVVFEGVVT